VRPPSRTGATACAPARRVARAAIGRNAAAPRRISPAIPRLTGGSSLSPVSPSRADFATDAHHFDLIAVFADSRNAFAVGAPLLPALRIFSPLPALMRSRLAWMFAYKPCFISRFYAAGGKSSTGFFGLRTFAPRTNCSTCADGGGGLHIEHLIQSPKPSSIQPRVKQFGHGASLIPSLTSRVSVRIRSTPGAPRSRGHRRSIAISV